MSSNAGCFLREQTNWNGSISRLNKTSDNRPVSCSWFVCVWLHTVYVKKGISGLLRVSCWSCLRALKELYRELLTFEQVCAGRGELSWSVGSKNPSFLVQHWSQIVTQRYCTGSLQGKRMEKGPFRDLASVEREGVYQFLWLFCLERTGEALVEMFCFMQLMATGLS